MFRLTDIRVAMGRSVYLRKGEKEKSITNLLFLPNDHADVLLDGHEGGDGQGRVWNSAQNTVLPEFSILIRKTICLILPIILFSTFLSVVFSKYLLYNIL